MPSLRRPNSRLQFVDRLTIIEGGSGSFNGILDEPPQGSGGASSFTEPRRLLRVDLNQSIPVGTVIQSATGTNFIVAHHGNSEGVFKSYRLFDTTGHYKWQRRTKNVDPVTGLPRDELGKQEMGMIWGVLEPLPEQFDRQIRSSFEISRFITNKPIQRDDIVEGNRVTRVDKLLGIYVASLG